MEYYLHAEVLDTNPSLPLTKDEFDSLRAARSTLKASFAIEETFDLLLANYRELELSALKASVDELASVSVEYNDFFAVRSELNRRALNLLSAARLYLDQFPQWLRDIGLDPEPIHCRKRHLYDSAFEYRFMEALRNHVQHVGLAVHGITMGSKWVPEGKRENLESQVIPYAMKSALADDKKFKASVLAECSEKIAIMPAARKYVETLSMIHQEIRKRTDPIVSLARELFQKQIQQHELQAKQRIPGLAAIAKDKESIKERIPVFLDWDDVRVKLVQRNRAAINLSKQYITSFYKSDT